MNNNIITVTSLLALGALGAVAAEIKSAEDLTDTRSKASYGLGFQAANLWKGRGADIDWDAYIKGLRDVAAGSSNLLSNEQVSEAMRQFQNETQERFRTKQAIEGAKNKEAGDKFLAENKAKEGVKTTDSGLQYQVLTMGTGNKPAAADRVTVHYTGTLIDGKKFDSSLDKGQPITFPLNNVIRGWTEGVQLMPVGSKFKFFIPPNLAYSTNAPPAIGPNQVLIFEVELIKAEAAPPPQASSSGPVTSDIIKVPSSDELKKGAKIEVIKAEDAKKLVDEEQKKKKPENN